MWKKFKGAFNRLPSSVQVAIYVGVSASIAVLIDNLESGQPVDLRSMFIPVLAIVINVLAYLVARED